MGSLAIVQPLALQPTTMSRNLDGDTSDGLGLYIHLPGRVEDALDDVTDRVTSLREKLEPVDPLISTARELLAPLRRVVETLDDVAKIHPFVAVPVLAFKAILNLELTRRENDRRIAALFNQMGDMIAHLVDLGRVKNVQDEQRWVIITQNIKSDIAECGNTIDVYYKQRLLLKIAKSRSWQEKLESFARTFAKHTQTLQLQLSITVNVVASDTDANVRALDAKVDVVINLLRQRPKIEENVSKYIKSQGGLESIIADDEKFSILLERAKSKYGLAGNEARNPTAAAAYRACVRAALSAPGIERLIMDNRAIWKMKLDDQTVRLESVVELNTQRVLLAIASRDGPYQSVLHPQVRETWKTEGWHGSVTGHVLIQGLSDFFMRVFMEYECTHAGASHPEAWTLKYFGHAYRSILSESLDNDCSGFVSIQEINRFTRRIPDGCSLPLWVAYRTAGWMLETAQYRHRILQLYDELNHIRTNLPYSHHHPNYIEVSTYVDAVGETVHDLFAGLQLPARRLRTAYMEEGLYAYVNNAMQEREAMYEERLTRAKWEVDGPTALVAIVGTCEPIERYLLPFLFVVLRHHTRVLSVTAHRKVDQREVSDAWSTLDNIVWAIIDRVTYLQDNFQRFPGGVREEGLLDHFACGLFSRVKPHPDLEDEAELPWGVGQYSATSPPPSPVTATFDLPILTPRAVRFTSLNNHGSRSSSPMRESPSNTPIATPHAVRFSSLNGHSSSPSSPGPVHDSPMSNSPIHTPIHTPRVRLSSLHEHGSRPSSPQLPAYPLKLNDPLDPRRLRILNYPCEALPEIPPPYSRPQSPITMLSREVLSHVAPFQDIFTPSTPGDFRPKTYLVPGSIYHHRSQSTDHYRPDRTSYGGPAINSPFPFFSALACDEFLKTTGEKSPAAPAGSSPVATTQKV